MPERCDCCDLLPESCGKAIEQRRRAEQLEAIKNLPPGWFAAKFPGTCTNCGEDFDADTPITFSGGLFDRTYVCCQS